MRERAKADSPLTTLELKGVRGPVRSEGQCLFYVSRYFAMTF
jgi:hypothetical protein